MPDDRDDHSPSLNLWNDAEEAEAGARVGGATSVEVARDANDEQPAGPALRCDGCNKFTSRAAGSVVADEMGDYGVVYSYLFLCNRERCPGA
jgi:hypothetical protein